MLQILQNLKDKIENLPVRDFLKEAVEENAEYIADLNTDQMYAGIRSDGTEIEPEYKQISKELKKLAGQPFDRVTLYGEGDFHKETVATNADKEGFELYSTNWKEKKLKAKYGDKIFGLTKQSKQELKDERLKESLQQKTRDYFK